MLNKWTFLKGKMKSNKIKFDHLSRRMVNRICKHFGAYIIV